MSEPNDIKAEAAGAGARLRGYKILVVDDEEDARTFLTAVLQDAGAQVEEAGDGAEALTMAVKVHPDLITLDLSMPGTDGVQAFNELRQTPALAEIPICIITGHPEFRSVIYSRPVPPPEGYLNKPLAAEELVETVRRIFELRQKKASRRVVRAVPNRRWMLACQGVSCFLAN